MNAAIDSINSVSQDWAQFAVSSTWQSTLVALVLIAFVVWAKKLPSPVRYGILLVALLKFASPPFFDAPSGIFSSVEVSAVAPDKSDFKLPPAVAEPDRFESVFDSSDDAVEPFGRVDQADTRYDSSSSQPQLVPGNAFSLVEPKDDIAISSTTLPTPRSESTKLTIFSWLMLVQILGSLFLVTKLLAEWIRLKHLSRTSSRNLTEQQRDMFEVLCQRFRFIRQPELLVSKSISAPISFGCLHPKVVIPESVISNEEFASIAITHELAHLCRFDSWSNWIQNLLLAVWWYNPVLWLLNGQIRKIREDCCDDIVLSSGMATSCQYGESLVEIAKLSNEVECTDRLQTAFSMARHPLKSRLIRIMNSGLPRARRLSWSGALVVTVLCALCLPGLRLVIGESGVEVADELVEGNSTEKNSASVQEETIVLTFPEGLEIGTLEVLGLPKERKDWTGYFSFEWAGKAVGPAVGKVSVPKESYLSLNVTNEKLHEKLDHLVGVPIGRLMLINPTVTTELLTKLEKIDSLQQIYFRNCTVDAEIDLSNLNGLPILKVVNCQYQSDCDPVARQQLSKWTAKSKQLQSLYGGHGGGAAGLDVIKAFAQHSNPLFLNVDLDDNASEKIQALAKIPNLISLNVQVMENVSADYHKYLGQLRALRLANWGGGELTSSLMDGLIELPSLDTLGFQGQAKATTEFIERLPELKLLQAVRFNVSLSSEEKELLTKAMMRMPALRILPRIVAPSAELLGRLANRTDITYLEIEGLGSDATVEQLVGLIHANKNLENLKIIGVDASDDLVRTICDLRELSFLYLKVHDFDEDLFAPLERLTSLRSMYLEIHGRVRDLSVLASLPNLTSIQIWVNSLDTELWKFVGDCPKLRSFDILTGVSDNKLADWVAKSRSLRHISLGQDMFMTDAGVKKFAECDQLESLTVGGKISKDAVMSLRRLPNLGSLTVWSDELSVDDQQDLKEAFKDLRRFESREHYPSIGKVNPGEDGFFRDVPEGGRAKLDALEGQGIEKLLKDSLSAEIKEKLKDRVVMVEFWGTWCGPCLTMQPEFQRLHELYHDKGFEILAIHSESGKEECEDFLKKHPKVWPNIIDQDGSLSESFAVPNYPSMYFFDRDGKLRVAKAHRLGLAETIETLLEE